MPVNKNQHFVPQFYLRAWSRDDRSIHLMHIDSGRHVPTASIKDQCSKPYLYGDDPEVEEAIQEIERKGAAAIRRIIEVESVPEAGSAEAEALVNFAVLQHHRTPMARAESAAFDREIDERLLRSGFPPERLEELVREDPIEAVLDRTRTFAPYLYDLDLHLVVNQSPVGFVTSDVAVAMHNMWCERARGIGVTGFVCGGLQVFMPVSPKHLLLLTDRHVYKVGTRRSLVHGFTTAGEAEQVNALQHEAAHHNLYFDGDPTTKQSVARMLGKPRTPRHLRVSSSKAVEAKGESELLHVYSEPSKVRLKLPWLSIRRNQRRPDLVDRIQSWRPEAMAMDSKIGALGDPRHDEAPARRRTWHIVAD